MNVKSLKNKPNHVKNEGSKQLFKNNFLEQLTKTHFAVPVSIFYAVAIFLLYYAISEQLLTKTAMTITFGIGFIVFTLTEYWVHRTVFHFETDTTLKEKLQLPHAIHHEYPKDKTRLAMPPIVTIVLAVVLYGIFRLLLQDYVYAFLPGFLIGYSTYLCVHYTVHAYKAPNNFFRYWWVFHAIHHYRDNKVAFGVSSPIWDWVFGTMPKM
jgi:sterol desaturase/sphingolipid hydroxylase (fatty acid hydroxylase superfamily)